MTTELIAFLVMVGVFLLGCFLCKLPVSLSMVLASVAGAIAGGQGLALRHLVEGRSPVRWTPLPRLSSSASIKSPR